MITTLHADGDGDGDKRPKKPKKVKPIINNTTPENPPHPEMDIVDILLRRLNVEMKSEQKPPTPPSVAQTPQPEPPKVQHTLPTKVFPKTQDDRDLDTLMPIMGEFLQSFVVIGYTLEGRKICRGQAATQQEHDALIEHLRTSFITIMNNHTGHS